MPLGAGHFLGAAGAVFHYTKQVNILVVDIVRQNLEKITVSTGIKILQGEGFDML